MSAGYTARPTAPIRMHYCISEVVLGYLISLAPSLKYLCGMWHVDIDNKRDVFTLWVASTHRRFSAKLHVHVWKRGEENRFQENF